MIGKGIDVCIVEDDEGLREELVSTLGSMGFGVRRFRGSRELYVGLLEAPCHILVLGLTLPGEGGLTITQRIKGIRRVGILILTARNDIDTVVRCLTGGADACLIKPIDPRELAANLVSLHRRVNSTFPDRSAAHDWKLQGDGWTLVCPVGKPIALTASERLLLQALFDSPNAPVERADLIAALGHKRDYYLDHRLDMLFNRLRNKVRKTTGRTLPLKALRSIGFMLSLRQR